MLNLQYPALFLVMGQVFLCLLLALSHLCHQHQLEVVVGPDVQEGHRSSGPPGTAGIGVIRTVCGAGGGLSGPTASSSGTTTVMLTASSRFSGASCLAVEGPASGISSFKTLAVASTCNTKIYFCMNNYAYFSKPFLN